VTFVTVAFVAVTFLLTKQAGKRFLFG